MTILFVLTFAILVLNLFKLFNSSLILPFFTLYLGNFELKVSPTMWYFFYPSLLFQIWFWFTKYGII